MAFVASLAFVASIAFVASMAFLSKSIQTGLVRLTQLEKFVGGGIIFISTLNTVIKGNDTGEIPLRISAH